MTNLPVLSLESQTRNWCQYLSNLLAAVDGVEKWRMPTFQNALLH